jgi:hypothetical protein
MTAIYAGQPTVTGNKIPKGYKQGQLQQFTPEQMQLFQQLLSQLGPNSFLSQLVGGDEGAFTQMEAPALKQFSELQGGLASRFSGMGLGGRKSSGFQNTMNQASSDFAQQLMANRQNLQRQALMDLYGLSGSLLQQRPYEQFLTKMGPSFKQKLVGAGAGAATGAATGFAAGNVPGALLGALLGGGVGYSSVQ